MFENIRLAFQGIWSHKMRSFLTMLGIIIGIASIIAIVSTIKGTSEQIKVTQATVSRDIRDLRLTKVAVDGSRQKYVVLAPEKDEMNEKYIRVLRDGYISMDMAQNILVIKTVSGMAMAVAAAVDAMKWKEVVGCIAGDDTIMCAIRSVQDTEHVMDKIRKIVSKGI